MSVTRFELQSKLQTPYLQHPSQNTHLVQDPMWGRHPRHFMREKGQLMSQGLAKQALLVNNIRRELKTEVRLTVQGVSG